MWTKWMASMVVCFFIILGVARLGIANPADSKPDPNLTNATPDLLIHVEKGLLTVSLKDADLLDVMKALAKESGIKVKVDKGAQKKITLSFKDMPFDKGIRNVIRPLNYAMMWKTTKDGKAGNEEILTELDVFREGHQGSAAVLFSPEETPESGGAESKIHQRIWSDETRKKMLEKLQVRPSAP